MTSEEIAAFLKQLKHDGLSEEERAVVLRTRLAEEAAAAKARSEAKAFADAEAERRTRVAVATLQTAVALYEIEERRLRRYNSIGATISRFFSF